MRRDDLLAAVGWMIQEQLQEEETQDGPPEGEPLEHLADVAELPRERVRLIAEGEEEPTLTELAALLSSLGIGWGDFGRRLREWERLQLQAPPHLDRFRRLVREDEVSERLGEILRRLEDLEDRLRRLEPEDQDAHGG